MDLRHLVQPHLFPSRRLQYQVPQAIQIVPIRRRQPYRHRESPLPLNHFRNRHPARRRIQQLLHIGHVQPHPRQRRPVHQHVQLRHAKQNLSLRISRPRHRINNRQRLVRQLLQLLRILPENLNRHIGLDARNDFVQPHRHRLRKVVGNPANPLQPRRHLLNQRRLRLAARPLLARLQQHVHIGLINPHRLRRQVRPPQLRHHPGHLRKLLNRLLNPLADLHRFRQRDPRHLPRRNQQRSLVQPRHKLRA